jgi:Zn-dependent protease
MQWSSWEIGRVLGIPIRVHGSWFFVFFLVTWSLATGELPERLPGLGPFRYWVMGGIAAILMFASVLLHELGHSYVAQHYRIPIERITLFLFGGVAHMQKEPPHPRAEFFIAVAGPLVSFALAGLCAGFLYTAESVPDAARPHGLTVLSVVLAQVNATIGLFNLIPGYPLDGGRVLRAGLWAWGKDFYRATDQAALLGGGFGTLFSLLGAFVVYWSLIGALPGSMAVGGGWIVVIGTFLAGTALSSRRQAALRRSLAAIPVADIMVRAVVSIPPDQSLDEAVNRYFVPYGYGGFPVHAGGRLVGLLGVDDVRSVPQTLWPWRQVGQAMRPISSGLTISPEAPVIQALERMTQAGSDRLVVVQGEEVVGLVTRSAVAHFLHLHRA